MKKETLIAIGVSLLAVSACQKTWTKPGASSAEFERDKFTCLQQSQQNVGQAQITGGGGYVNGTANSGMQTNGLIFDSCMGARGWNLQNKQQAEAARESGKQKQDQFNEAQKAINDKFKAMCENPEYSVFYMKTGCAPNDISFAQLADISKITPAERDIVIKVQSELSKNRTAYYRNIVEFYGNQQKDRLHSEVYKKFIIDLNDKNSLDLIEGRITWGDWNRKRKENSDEYNAQRAKIFAAN